MKIKYEHFSQAQFSDLHLGRDQKCSVKDLIGITALPHCIPCEKV